MFYGINVDQKDYTICQMNENKKIISISHFWKEGLYWFIDHHKPEIITINLPGDNEFDASLKLKTAVELIQKLKKNFEYITADIQAIKNKEEKIIVKTIADLFFKKIVRKELLPFHTREGLEQRLYNMKKTGIKINKEILAKDKNKLKKELGSIIAAFNSYSVANNSYEKIEEDGDLIIVPKYKFVPSTKRIIRKNQ